MAIAPLDQRLTSMMSDQDLAVPADIPASEIAQQDSKETQYQDTQVAGLFDAPGDVIRIIKQGTKKIDVLKDIANQNANEIEILREQATAAAEAKKRAAITEKANATRAVTKQQTADVDAMTGGALSAKTPEDRATKLNTWLESNPDTDKVADVYKRLQKKDPAAASLLEQRLKQGTPEQADILQADPNVTKLEPLVSEPTVQPTERPDLIPNVDPERVKAFLSGEAPDDIPLDISFQNMKDPQDIDFVIRKTEEMFADEFYQAKRGKVTDAETNELASYMNMEPDLLKRQVGTVFNDRQIQASKLVIKASALKIEDMRQKIIAASKVGVDDRALLVDFTNQLGIHAAMQMNFKAAKSEAARALRASRVYKDDTGIIDAERLTAMIDELGGVNNVKNMANMMGLMEEAEKAKFIQQAGTNLQVFGGIWKEVWMGGIMSAPATFVRMSFGSAFQSLMRPIDSAFASTTGRAWDVAGGVAKDFVWTKQRTEIDDDFVSVTESAIELANFMSGFGDAMKVASRAFRNDAPVYNVGRNIDSQPDPAITSKLFKDPNSPIAQMTDMAGKAIRLPFRGALFVDEGTKALVGNMEIRKLAARDAAANIKNGMSPDDAMLLMADQITNPNTDTLERVELAMKDASLQSDMGGFGNWVMATRKSLDENPYFGGLPVGTMLAPFVKTVINAEKNILSRTLFAPLLSEVRTELQAGGARRQMALGKIHAGSALMMTAYWMTENGTLTGLGPPDPKKRQWLKENEGWQECSLKVNDKYYSLAGLEPIGGLLCSAATVAEMGSVYGKDDDASFGDILTYSMLLPFKYIGQLPMMDGLGRFFDTLQEVSRDPTGEKTGEIMNKFFGTYTQSMVGGVTPIPMPFSGLLRQIERTIDPSKNEVTLDPSLPSDLKYFDFGLRSWLAGTPLMSSSLKPKRNFWGVPVDSASFIKDAKNDNLSTTLREMSDKRGRMIVNMPSKMIDNVRLNDNEYSDLLLSMNQVQLNGVSMRQQISSDVAIFKSETSKGAYAGLANKLSETVSAYRDEALKTPTMMMYQDLQRNIAANKAKADNHVDMIKRQPKD